MELKEIYLTDIQCDEDFNCRGKINRADVIDLAASIRENGLQQPVTVSELDNNKYKLVCGFRRFKAHELLEKETILCVVREKMSYEETIVANFVENLSRRDLTIQEEAEALRRMENLGITEEDAAKFLGKSRGWVQTRFQLLRLPKEVQNLAGKNLLSTDAIRKLYSFKNPEDTILAAQEYARRKESGEKNIKISKPYNSTKRDLKKLKRCRARHEMISLLDFLAYLKIAPCFASRCLAWAAGEICTDELYSDIADEIADRGLPKFVIPEGEILNEKEYLGYLQSVESNNNVQHETT